MTPAQPQTTVRTEPSHSERLVDQQANRIGSPETKREPDPGDGFDRLILVMHAHIASPRT
ncbi:hypothetical protein ACFIOY_09930 [Bradyrhizobium sp. TZ2]